MYVLLKNTLRAHWPQNAISGKKVIVRTLLICFALFSMLPVFAQNAIQVKGKVVGDNGLPVAKATVTLKGSSTAAVADDAGNYTISAPSTGTLLFSAVGFAPQEIKINNRQTIDVTLATFIISEGEVVVIGYGTQRKREVSGSIVTVKGETLSEIKAPNILSQLQGRAAGVDIVNNSSQIGSGGEIRIRGNRSITGNNNPLIVIDGMAYGGSLNDITSDNIASMEILKDASATAIFGSRGSNGVIIITTKRGTSQKAVTTYNGYVAIIKPQDTWRIFNGTEYAKFKEDARQGQPGFLTNPNITSPYQLTAIENTNLAEGVNTDWQDMLLTTGVRTGHDLGIRGGSDKTQFYFGAGYFRETGIVPDQELNRFNFNINIDHKISERIKVGFTSFNTLVRSNRLGTSAFGSGTRLGPLYKPYNSDGSINMLPASQQGVDQNQINPLTSIGNDEIIKGFQRRFQFQHNFYAEWKIIKELKFKTTAGYGWAQTFNSNYTGPNTVFNTNATTAGSNMSQSNSEGWQYTINNSLEFTNTYGKHRVQVQALQEVQKNHFQAQQFNGQGVPADYIQDYNWQLVNTVTPQAGNYSESALIGYMGRAIWAFDEKYSLTATIRTDGASVLAEGNQWVTYPAISAGWNIDRENFMQNATFIDALKLRVGWGISSNAGIGPYTTLGSLANNFYNFGSGSTVGVNYANGYLLNTSPNPNLTWEKTAGFNVGIDFAFFKNRLSGSIEYYNNKTTDILLNKQLPRSNGTNSILDNAGETSSTGMEFTINSVNVKSPGGFVWRTDFNLFFNREKITALQLGLQRDLVNGWFVGHPITVIFDYKKEGIWQTSEATQAAVYGTAPGDIKIQDVGKDNVINASDRQIIGNFQPDFVAGMTNNFAYKNFDLNIVMFGRFGQTVVATYLSADGSAAGYPFFLNSRVNQLKVDYWTPTNPTNAFPQPDASKDNLLYTSTLTYQDGSFIKIRAIDFGYTLPDKWMNKAGIQSLRTYISVQNPFILWSPLVSDNLGLDPEGNVTGNNIAAGTQGGGATAVPGRAVLVNMGIPPTRQFVFGVNLRF